MSENLMVMLDLASTYKKLRPLPRFGVQFQRNELCQSSDGKDNVGGLVRGKSGKYEEGSEGGGPTEEMKSEVHRRNWGIHSRKRRKSVGEVKFVDLQTAEYKCEVMTYKLLSECQRTVE
jgi:hypothetical protein